MRNPTGSKARTARPVARTIFTGVFMSPQNGSERVRSSAERRAERIPRPERTRRIVERQRGKNPGPGSWSCPRGIREEETVPYRARTKSPLKLTRSVFMFIPQSFGDSSQTLGVACIAITSHLYRNVTHRQPAWKLYIIQYTPSDALLSAKKAGCQEIRWP